MISAAQNRSTAKSKPEGAAITFGDEMFDLVLNVMIGIRRSVDNALDIP